MTPAGWAIMMTSVGGVLGWWIYCLFRALTLPSATVEKHLHAPLDIETGDRPDGD